MSYINLRHFTFILAILVTASAAAPGWAERPAAPLMLPASTAAYVRIRDGQELKEKFNATAFGQVLQDEEIAPLIAQLYGSAAQAFTAVQERIGVGLDGLLQLPQGEMVFAAIAPPGERPILIAWIDVGDALPQARTLLERGDEAIQRDGARYTREEADGVTFHIYDRGDDTRQRILYFEKEATIVFCTHLDFAQEFVARWDGEPVTDGQGEPVGVLARNERFAAIMSRCRGARDEPPQITWFADPVEIARSVTRGNVAAQTTLAFLPVVGLDGLHGVGGSLTLAGEDFDMVSHLHVLTDSPRRGILKMVAFAGGDTAPEAWVPGDAASYATVHWKLEDTYHEAAKLFDSFNSDGALRERLESFTQRNWGIAFEAELLEHFAGRVSTVNWFERPIVLGSETRIVAVQVKDGERFRSTFEKLLAKFDEHLEKEHFGSHAYYTLKMPQPERRPIPEDASPQRRARLERRQAFQADVRAPRPSVMLHGDYLFFATQPTGLHKVLSAAAGGGDESLAGKLDFKLIASKIRRQVGGAEPSLVTFNRPAESWRAAYEFLQSEQAKVGLAGAAENNRFAADVQTVLQDNPLPPFAVIEKYLAPGGGMIVADETGFHYTGFTLKRKQ